MNWYALYKTAARSEAWLTGVLGQTKDGFVYVNVSNDVINGFYHCLDEDKAIQPPYREEKYNGIGAHISVMDPEEIEGHHFRERGNKIRYQVRGVFQANPDRGKMSRIWALEVHSPELENIRRRYGLSPNLRGHSFHITFAVEPR